MVKAVFLDFCGTVVHEDGDIINDICDCILQTGIASDRSQIGRYWWNEFQTLFTNSYGQTFRTQRELEYQSIVNTIKHFQSSENANDICRLMFARWEKPPVFEEAREFLAKCPVPVYIISNIDNNDIRSAMGYNRLKFAKVFTSEDARSYKPRKEIFEMALKETGLLPEEVVHIGDSFSSDVKGARALGIHAIWLNRSGKPAPEDVSEVADLMQVLDTTYFK